MKIIFAIAFLLPITCAIAQEAQRPSFLGGSGATRCEKWSNERAVFGSILRFGNESWILGFISGAFALDENGMLSGFTEDDVLSRVDFYCRMHKNEFLIRAALEVTADLDQTIADQIKRSLKGKTRHQ
jgi:hypothetical protein